VGREILCPRHCRSSTRTANSIADHQASLHQCLPHQQAEKLLEAMLVKAEATAASAAGGISHLVLQELRTSLRNQSSRLQTERSINPTTIGISSQVCAETFPIPESIVTFDGMPGSRARDHGHAPSEASDTTSMLSEDGIRSGPRRKKTFGLVLTMTLLLCLAVALAHLQALIHRW
jgi:hypothetical protein